MSGNVDPLSFFAQGTSSSSESEDEESEKPLVAEESSESDSELTSTGQPKLPTPNKLFANISKPDFLNTPQHLDWDKYTKNIPEENIHESQNYAAIPPPKEGVMLTSGDTITGQAVKYDDPELDRTKNLGGTKVLDVNTSIELGMKRSKTSSTDDSSSKREKTVETFREKEKRKRNMGMQSRGKSYVEEEKRILRQQFSVDQQLN